LCYPFGVNAARAQAAILCAGWALGPLAPAAVAAPPGGLLAAPLAGSPKGQTPDAAAKKRAAALFREGEDAFRRHRYVDAADAFERAYQVVPHPASMSNAIDARIKAGQNARAAALCALLVRELGPESGERGDTERRLAELLPKVGRLELEGEGASEVGVDGQPVELGTSYVEPGDHVVRARARGAAIERAVSVQAGASQRLVLEPVAAPAPVAVAVPLVVAGGHAAAPRALGGAPVERGAEARPGKPLSPVWFFVSLGATAAAGGLALWSGLDTVQARNAWDAHPTAAGLEEGRDKQLRTNVLLGATAGLALVSGALGVFATDWSGGPQRVEARAGVALAAGPGGASVHVRF
jgi:hypothetical protein